VCDCWAIVATLLDLSRQHELLQLDPASAAAGAAAADAGVFLKSDGVQSRVGHCCWHWMHLRQAHQHACADQLALELIAVFCNLAFCFAAHIQKPRAHQSCCWQAPSRRKAVFVVVAQARLLTTHLHAGELH
jgi:hypothetical protein